MGNDFSVDNVMTALSAFSRNINHSHKNVFSGIFKTLEQGISKLGDTSVSRTKAIKNLIEIINDVPTSNQRDYDVLGFVYEYLISQFASSAGIQDMVFVPIYAQRHKTNLCFSQDTCNYTAEGREKIHQSLKAINKNVLSYVMTNFIPNKTIRIQRQPHK